MIRALNVDKLRLDMGEYVLSVAGLRARSGLRRVLDGIDLDVKRGAAVALVGTEGAGKSLLLACIAGAVAADSGRIRYFGYEIRRRPQTRIARMGIVRTHQTGQPFGDMSVLDTVTVGAFLRRARLDRARARAQEVLAVCGLAGRADRTYSQLDDLDRKRLELARALATDPHVLLLDDLGAGLSPTASAELADTLAAVRKGALTVVAAARSVEQCPIVADDIVEIERGTTARNGAYATLHL